jgi:hypothetical protein
MVYNWMHKFPVSNSVSHQIKQFPSEVFYHLAITFYSTGRNGYARCKLAAKQTGALAAVWETDEKSTPVRARTRSDTF